MNEHGIPIMVPMMHQPPQAAPMQRAQELPVRITVAMDYLRLMHHKQAKQVAVNSIAVEVVDGLEMNEEERITHGAACRTLFQFFRGELTMSAWESADHASYMAREAARLQRHPQGGTIIRCVACTGEDESNRPDCNLCRGTGRILVHAVTATEG